jgi:hypothetical protein
MHACKEVLGYIPYVGCVDLWLVVHVYKRKYRKFHVAEYSIREITMTSRVKFDR